MLVNRSQLNCSVPLDPLGPGLQLAYSKWHHRYPRFPLEALRAASVLNEYTFTDRDKWLSSLRAGMWTLDPPLNSAHVLSGSKAKRRLRF
ncbi:hypothetical protein PAXINDRAFT_75601 [Paxillus involutus ATCC 200175]|nr:hypothetical protein PAXINDRAFT_75601 [Paxillus involutus ATCC 200175]